MDWHFHKSWGINVYCAGAEKGQVKPWQCQAALAVTQTAFCVGSVYLKSSLRQVDSSDGHVFHPIIYAFLREATAGPIMCAMAWFTSGAAPFCICQYAL